MHFWLLILSFSLKNISMLLQNLTLLPFYWLKPNALQSFKTSFISFSKALYPLKMSFYAYLIDMAAYSKLRASFWSLSKKSYFEIFCFTYNSWIYLNYAECWWVKHWCLKCNNYSIDDAYFSVGIANKFSLWLENVGIWS